MSPAEGGALSRCDYCTRPFQPQPRIAPGKRFCQPSCRQAWHLARRKEALARPKAPVQFNVFWQAIQRFQQKQFHATKAVDEGLIVQMMEEAQVEFKSFCENHNLPIDFGNSEPTKPTKGGEGC
jgi:hypothetical protein